MRKCITRDFDIADSKRCSCGVAADSNQSCRRKPNALRRSPRTLRNYCADAFAYK